MADLPDKHTQVLNEHSSPGETPEAVYTDGNRTLAATDRRLIEVVSQSNGSRDAWSVETVSYEHVASVEVEVVGEEPPDSVALFLAVVFGLAGIALLIGSATLSGAQSGIAAIVGVLGLVVGVVLGASAIDTDSGHVSLEVRTTTGKADQAIELPEDRADFAATVNEHVATEQGIPGPA